MAGSRQRRGAPSITDTLSLFDRLCRELRCRVRAKGSRRGGSSRPGSCFGRRRPVGVEIAERVGCSEPTVLRWRSRFAEHGLAGLDDAPRSGEPPQVSQLGLSSCPLV